MFKELGLLQNGMTIVPCAYSSASMERGFTTPLIAESHDDQAKIAGKHTRACD